MAKMILLLVLSWPPVASANSYSRGDLAPHLPSILNWKKRKGEPAWGDLFLRYSPHFILLAGDDPNTIASIGSRLSHKGTIGIKKNWGDNNRAGLGYTVDFLSFYRNQGVATLDQTHLTLNEVFLFNEYLCMDRFSIITQIAYRERPYYTRVSSNNYNLEKEGHAAPSIGTQFLMFQSGRYAFAADAAYTYFFAGPKHLIGDKNISSLRFATEISRTSFDYEIDRNRLAVDLYFDYQFADSSGVERTLKDLGITLKYDFSI